jgi:hypothetical protein
VDVELSSTNCTSFMHIVRSVFSLTIPFSGKVGSPNIVELSRSLAYSTDALILGAASVA